jgi:hypothetical protein
MTRNYIHVHGHNNKREISISSHHINSVPNTCNFFPIPAGETSTDSRLLKETPSKEFVPSLMLTNVMSLAPKIDEVSLFLLNKNPDVVFITETWLTNAIDKSHINIPEYNVVCKNRSSGSHGGVCLYLRNSISYEILDHFHNAETEVLWVKIRPTRLPRGFPCIITGTLYHPPSSDNNVMLEYLAKSLTDIEGHYPGCGIILAGDFNRLIVSRLSRQFRMKQLIHLHTRGDQTLDLVLTNLNKFYDKNSLSSFPPFGLSDHNVLLLNPKERRSFSSRDRKKVFWKRDKREIRKQELGRYLSSLSWDILNNIKSCNRKEQLFEDVIKTGMDIIMPLKKTKLHANNQPWITPEFITLIKRRQKAFAQKKMTEFRHYRNLVNRERKRLRDNYFSTKVIHLKGTKPSVWWRELKRI